MAASISIVGQPIPVQASGSKFSDVHGWLAGVLRIQTPFNPETWHSVDVSKSPAHRMLEIRDVTMVYNVPYHLAQLFGDIEPSAPWAEDHFQERVSGQPLNPPPSHRYWPYGNTTRHTTDTKFSHTYPERFWPKFANVGEKRPNGRQVWVPHNGIRYEYGDLMNVVDLLRRNPMTRQAYLPVWFPEDTGNVSNVRVPCSLGYHFMLQRTPEHVWRLSCRYFIRSVDFIRHFRDDVYMAGRLMQWVCDQLQPGATMDDERFAVPGNLIMHMSSLHAFTGDMAKLKAMAER